MNPPLPLLKFANNLFLTQILYPTGYFVNCFYIKILVLVQACPIFSYESFSTYLPLTISFLTKVSPLIASSILFYLANLQFKYERISG